MKTEPALQSDNGISFIQKVIARSVNIFILLGDETINSSLVERDRSLMDPQPHLLLHFLVRMKLTSTNVFLQVAKNVAVTRGKIRKIWVVRRMFKCFPAKSPKFIPHHIPSMGTGVIMQKDDSIRQHSTAFWLYGASLYPLPPRKEPHLSALLCLPPFPMLDEHTLHYAHLQSNKETTVWTYAFSLCMSHGNIYTKQSVASFCEECVLWWVFGFHLTVSHN